MWKIPLMLLALAGTVYAIYCLNTRGIDGKLLYLEESIAAFQVNEVDRLQWITPNNPQYFVKMDGKWDPEKPKKIDEVVRFLSRLKSRQINSYGEPLIEVKVRVNKKYWTGIWDGINFVWTDGPIKGMGQVLSTQSNDFFAQGQWLFEDLELNLCHNRVKSLKIENEKTTTIQQVGKVWTANEKKLTPPFFEKWLVSLCKLPMTWLDLHFKRNTEKDPQNIYFTYVDGTKIHIQNRGGGLFTLNDKGFLSPKLDATLLNLEQELDGSVH